MLCYIIRRQTFYTAYIYMYIFCFIIRYISLYLWYIYIKKQQNNPPCNLFHLFILTITIYVLLLLLCITKHLLCTFCFTFCKTNSCTSEFFVSVLFLSFLFFTCFNSFQKSVANKTIFWFKFLCSLNVVIN